MHETYLPVSGLLLISTDAAALLRNFSWFVFAAPFNPILDSSCEFEIFTKAMLNSFDTEPPIEKSDSLLPEVGQAVVGDPR